MTVQTTRRLAQLQEQCRDLAIPFTEEDGRLELMDKLREKIGAFDLTTEIDPMKAKDLKAKIAWGSDDPYAGIAEFLTDAYVAEPKLDGARMRQFIGLTGSTMNTGRRSVQTFAYIDRTGNFPHIAGVGHEDLAGIVLDGEILAPTGKLQTAGGVWTDSLLNASVALVNSKPEKSVATQERFGRAQYWVFDMLTGPGGEDITHLTYDQRREALELVVATIQLRFPDSEIRIVPQLPADTSSITEALKLGFEGVMLKLRSGVYRPGKRGGEWLKVKTMSTADAFITGYTPGENRHTGKVGSLELSVYEGGMPRAIASVGNLTDEYRDILTAADGTLRQDAYGIVIEFMGQGIGKNGRVRHPHMVRVRPDKEPQDCLVDQLEVFPRV